MYTIQIGRLEGERIPGIPRSFIPVFEVGNLSEQQMLDKISELNGCKLSEAMIDSLLNPNGKETFLMGYHNGYRTVRMN